LKKSVLLSIVLLLLAYNAYGAAVSETKKSVRYKPSWESLKTAPIPEWVMDAKFGVYTHWGVYSVPAYKTNTYFRDMYAPNYELDKKGVRKWSAPVFSP